MHWLYILSLLTYTILPILAAEPIIVSKPDDPVPIEPGTSEPGGGTREPSGSSGDEPGGEGTSCAGMQCLTDPSGTTGTEPESESPLLEELGEHLEDVVDFINSLLPSAAATSTTTADSPPTALAVATNPIITTTPTSIPSGASACLRAARLYDSCASSLSSSFSAMPQSSQASCLCYTIQNNNDAFTPTSSWLPYMGDCNSYVQTQTMLQDQKEDMQYAADMCISARDALQYSSTAVASPTTQVTPSTGGAARPTIRPCNLLLLFVVGSGLGFYIV